MMKKLAILISLIFVTGCGVKTVPVGEFNKLKQEVRELKKDVAYWKNQTGNNTARREMNQIRKKNKLKSLDNRVGLNAILIRSVATGVNRMIRKHLARLYTDMARLGNLVFEHHPPKKKKENKKNKRIKRKAKKQQTNPLF